MIVAILGGVWLSFSIESSASQLAVIKPCRETEDDFPSIYEELRHLDRGRCVDALWGR